MPPRRWVRASDPRSQLELTIDFIWFTPASVSDFFEPAPDDRPELVPQQSPRRSPAWMGPPDGMLPGVVALELLLAKTAELAVCINGGRVFPTGLQFDLVTLCAPDAQRELDPLLFESQRMRGRPGTPAADALRFGVQYPDGAKATNTGPHPFEHGLREPSAPVLMERGGGGGGSTWTQEQWLWPLPGPGELSFVCEWPAAGIALSRATIDTTPIREAADRCQVVFSWEHVPTWDDEADEDDDGPRGVYLRTP